jgi:hypothetical protein
MQSALEDFHHGEITRTGCGLLAGHNIRQRGDHQRGIFQREPGGAGTQAVKRLHSIHHRHEIDLES